MECKPRVLLNVPDLEFRGFQTWNLGISADSFRFHIPGDWHIPHGSNSQAIVLISRWQMLCYIIVSKKQKIHHPYKSKNDILNLQIYPNLNLQLASYGFSIVPWKKPLFVSHASTKLHVNPTGRWCRQAGEGPELYAGGIRRMMYLFGFIYPPPQKKMGVFNHGVWNNIQGENGTHRVNISRKPFGAFGYIIKRPWWCWWKPMVPKNNPLIIRQPLFLGGDLLGYNCITLKFLWLKPITICHGSKGIILEKGW